MKQKQLLLIVQNRKQQVKRFANITKWFGWNELYNLCDSFNLKDVQIILTHKINSSMSTRESNLDFF